MKITEQTIVGELVAQNYRTAEVFKNSGIDFCCNGGRTIEQACEKKGIDAAGLIAGLENTLNGKNEQTEDFNLWHVERLADYIVEKHHRYVETKIGEILPFLSKVVKVHGGRHNHLAEVERLFHETAGELTMHMKKEELILFPFIRKLSQAKVAGGMGFKPPFGTVQNPINMMMHEHETEGERFQKIAALTENYTPPAEACNTYRVTLSLLKEFEEDLHKHIHLENNILFPKSIALEKLLHEQH